MKTLNERTMDTGSIKNEIVTINVKWIEVIDLLTACDVYVDTFGRTMTDSTKTEFQELHAKLDQAIDEATEAWIQGLTVDENQRNWKRWKRFFKNFSKIAE